MENSLIKSNLRSVISLVDKLRDIKLQQYIKLPKIVAVGSQSAGKSSLIQQVVGLDFLPRGTGVVTRRPLQIRMTYQDGLKQAYACFDQIPNKKFPDFSKVKASIEQLTDKVCGKNKNIVDQPIVLYVYSSNCPNLTIIDLPGLTRISLESQIENIHELTQKMIRKYMMEENTIILCVIPANQDITNDEVLYMARQIDVKGQRTIGCITKIDIMDRGTDARALLMNKGEVTLKLGYIGIKNRSQADINQNKNVQQSLDQQKMFFSKSPIYSSLPSNCLGTTSLVQKMTKVLENSIVNYIPTLLEKIRQKKSILSEKIKQYGRPLPKTTHQKKSLIWQICNEYILNYKNAIKNIPSSFASYQRIQKVSTHIQEQLQNFLKQESNANLEQILKDTKIAQALKKFDTINTLGFPSINSFLYLLTPLLNGLKTPMENSLIHLCDQVNHLAELIAGEVACEYRQFKQFIINKNAQIVNQFKKKSHLFIINMIECEVKGFTYQKLDFDRKVQKQKLTEIQIKYPLIPILRKTINKYYERCTYNLRQLVPKNISFFILAEATKKIEFQIFQTCGGSEEKIQKLLELSSYSVKQRIANQKEFDVIQKAQQHILTYGGFSRGGGFKKTKKREQRQKQMREAMEKQQQKKRKKQENLKILTEPNFTKKNHQTQTNPEKKPPAKSEKKIQEITVAKVAEKSLQKQKQPQKQEQKHSQKANIQIRKQNTLAQLFGNFTSLEPKNQQKMQQKKQRIQETPKFPPPQVSGKKQIFPSDSQEQRPLRTIKEKYNAQVGNATDKGVDEIFKNQKFQKQSKKVVEKGTSLAFQKQFGLSEQNADMAGKGAGFLWSNDKVQNAAKEQAKKQARDQTQLQ